MILYPKHTPKIHIPQPFPEQYYKETTDLVAPPTATFNDLGGNWGTGNSIVPYMMCDVLDQLVRQSVNQASTGTCALVGLLSNVASADLSLALRLSTELLWTGRLATYDSAYPEPCPVSLWCGFWVGLV